MVFCVSVGFSGLVKKGEDSKKDKQYALFIGDTLLVNEVHVWMFVVMYCTNKQTYTLTPFLTSFSNLEWPCNFAYPG